MKRVFIYTVILMFLPIIMAGQALRGSYFFDGSVQRNEMNPAFIPRGNYFSLPVLGMTGIGINSNLGIATFLYPKNGETYTYLNKNVTLDEFNNNLPKSPYMSMDFDMDILNFGFYTSEKAFWNVDLSIRGDFYSDLPRDLLLFPKKGMSLMEEKYSFGNFNIYTSEFAQLAVGHTRDLSDIVPGLKVGAKVKLYIGLNHINMKINNADIYMSHEEWRVKTDAVATVCTDLIDLEVGEEITDMKFKMGNITPGGFGAGVDLGAEYTLDLDIPIIDELRFSFAAIDLGGIGYGAKSVSKYKSAGEAKYTGFEGLSLTNYNMEENLQKITDEFLSLANLKEDVGGLPYTAGVRSKFHLGVEAPILNNLMSFGLLYSAVTGYGHTENEITLAYNLKPGKWFKLGVNYSAIRTGSCIGWLIEFTPKSGVDFFLGSDYTFLQVTPQFLPIKQFCADFRFGLSFMLGNKYN